MKKNNKKGFTVIELLAVVVVITILIVIAAASVYKVMQQAREKQYETNLDSMETSIKLFADDAKNGLSKVNNALVYKDENGKTWKIGCKKDELGNRTCCIAMTLLKDLGYLKVTEQDLCAENQKCIDYYANITYIGNNVDTEMLYNTNSCEIVKYEVVYHSVVKIDGTSEGIVKDYCEYNKECKLKLTPDEFKGKYPGHTIVGWEDRRGELYNPGESKDFTVKMVSDKLDLFAQWKNNEFTFTYHGNGSTSGTMTPSHHAYKDGSSLKPNAFLKTGYSYLGWNDQENGSGRSYVNNELVSDNTFDDGTNINLYAQWKANQYTITLTNTNATTAGTTSVTATYDSANLSSAITNPKRVYTITFAQGSSGATLSATSATSTWTFTGWWTAQTGGTKVIGTNGKLIASVSGYTNASKQWIKAGNATLYAQWSGGTITVPTATRTGYTCGFGTVTNPPTANKTYTASCTPSKYTVTFNKNTGNTPNPTTKSVTYGQKYGKLATITRSGCDFDGWWTDKNPGKGTKITKDTIVTITANQTLYAHWKSNCVLGYGGSRCYGGYAGNKCACDRNGNNCGVNSHWELDEDRDPNPEYQVNPSCCNTCGRHAVYYYVCVCDNNCSYP